jgi:hypothetical protein
VLDVVDVDGVAPQHRGEHFAFRYPRSLGVTLLGEQRAPQVLNGAVHPILIPNTAHRHPHGRPWARFGCTATPNLAFDSRRRGTRFESSWQGADVHYPLSWRRQRSTNPAPAATPGQVRTTAAPNAVGHAHFRRREPRRTPRTALARRQRLIASSHRVYSPVGGSVLINSMRYPSGSATYT